jgi:hypothetical protein
MEFQVSGGSVCKWRINLSREEKEIEKYVERKKVLPLILYCAGWAVIDTLFTTAKKDPGYLGLFTAETGP